MKALLTALALVAGSVLAAPTERAPRAMQISKVPELGLEIWSENQPPWDTELSNATGRPSFVVHSPDGYHPPTVMTYTSFPKENVGQAQLADMARSAIKRASQNFGLGPAEVKRVMTQAASYGALEGYEATFEGRADGVPMDVTVFVGQARGKFPVALSIYTLRGKIGTLNEQRRRAWGKLRYLAP